MSDDVTVPQDGRIEITDAMVERAYNAMAPAYFMEDDPGSYNGMSGFKYRQGLAVVRDMLEAALNG